MVVDPPAYTPPYDHALCAALARRGQDVELATSRFRHGETPQPEGYRRIECFYRLASGSRLAKALQHPLDMRRLARRVRREARDVVHFQWLPIPSLDLRLLRRFPPPRVLTAHDLPWRGANGQTAEADILRSLEAIVVHSEDGRRRLTEAFSVPPDKVHTIPHGAFDYLTRLPEERPLDRAVGDLDGRKVVLSFGLMRPYKRIDLLIEAFATTAEDAVLLVVGRPLMAVEPLRRRASELGVSDRVRFVARFVNDAEIPAYFRRADVVCLAYEEAEQSGVLATALAFGSPLVLSTVGGFTEIGERDGAAQLVPPGDAHALGVALRELLENDCARAAISESARRAAAGPYSWDRVAEQTLALYRTLVEDSP
jgi:glycosyltransferase involved in cell wall biosynthesis